VDFLRKKIDALDSTPQIFMNNFILFKNWKCNMRCGCNYSSTPFSKYVEARKEEPRLSMLQPSHSTTCLPVTLTNQHGRTSPRWCLHGGKRHATPPTRDQKDPSPPRPLERQGIVNEKVKLHENGIFKKVGAPEGVTDTNSDGSRTFVRRTAPCEIYICPVVWWINAACALRVVRNTTSVGETDAPPMLDLDREVWRPLPESKRPLEAHLTSMLLGLETPLQTAPPPAPQHTHANQPHGRNSSISVRCRRKPYIPALP
jgi:hypothetical protein